MMLRSQHVATGSRILFRFQTGSPDNLLVLGSLTVITVWAVAMLLRRGSVLLRGGGLPWENKVQTKCLPAPSLCFYSCAQPAVINPLISDSGTREKAVPQSPTCFANQKPSTSRLSIPSANHERWTCRSPVEDLDIWLAIL